MIVPEQAKNIVRHFEGLRLKPYYDIAGFPTIGYGHLLSREIDADLSKWPDITQEEADNLLDLDLQKAARSVIRLCPMPMTDGRLSALVDFVFNLGAGNLQISTLRKCIIRDDTNGAIIQFKRWVYAGSIKIPGLVRRRSVEIDLFIP